jgi:hypothetical protein
VNDFLAIKQEKSDRMQNTLSPVNLRTWYLTCHISWRGILDNKKMWRASLD